MSKRKEESISSDQENKTIKKQKSDPVLAIRNETRDPILEINQNTLIVKNENNVAENKPKKKCINDRREQVEKDY